MNREEYSINFNVPTYGGDELKYIEEAVKNGKICGDGCFTDKCSDLIEKITGTNKCLLTTSCTHAIELSALLLNIQEGDEIIAPSYTFVSSVNAFVLRGAKIVFVDIRPDTLNIDERLIEEAITEKTKAIILVHYAGVACEMYSIMNIARKYDLYVVEDAAQAIMSKYDGISLGTFGDFGCYSFHETKNINMGEGGALLIRDSRNVERAEIIREKGTNRSLFFRGQVDKYRWVDIGSSYLPSEINAAFLYAQLNQVVEITNRRKAKWEMYFELLSPLREKGLIELPIVPQKCEHNAHMFYIKTDTMNTRTRLIEFLKDRGILAVFHYVPLHSSPAGMRFGRFYGEDKYTTVESERILRLPLFDSIKNNEVEYCVNCIFDFYKNE